MSKIVEIAIAQSRMVLSLLAALVAMGIVSYISLPKEADPDIPIPFVYVGIPHPGISPEDAERLLIRPMEVELRTIEGLKEINAVAQQGMAAIGLEFDVNFDQDKALADVRERVDAAKSKLPPDSEEPIVQEFNASLWPVITVMISGDLPERALKAYADRLEDLIEANPSVLEVDVVGARQELLEVTIDPAKLEAYDVSANELFTAVNRNNRLVAAGALDTGEGRFAVKVPGLFETREDVLSLPLKAEGDAVVTLGDVADIRRTFWDAERYARFNGKPAVAVEVTKRIGENIVTTIEQVKRTVEADAENRPAGISVDFNGDASIWIDRSVSSLEQGVLTAILLVMIIVVAALGLRTGLIVGLAIPTSFLMGFLFLAIGGYTINMMVMFGMILAVGILVDGGIIIVEYADRMMAEGMERRAAYAAAGRRMFWPVISSTATTIAAFAPMLFWPGVSGKFMEYFPITVIAVLTASTLVALIFLPVVGALLGSRKPADEKGLAALIASESGDIRTIPGVTGVYARFVGRLIARPGVVLAATSGLLVAVAVAFSMFGKGVEFFVEQDPDQAAVLVQARGNLSAAEKRDLVLEVERRVLQVPGIAGAFTSTGGGGQSFGGGGNAPDVIGRVTIELQPFEVRGPGRPVIEAVRAATRDTPGIKVEVREFQGGPGGGKDIIMELRADDLAALTKVTGQVRAQLDSVTGLRDIDDTRPLPGIEWALQVNRAQAALYGADVSAVGSVVQLVTNGIKVGEYRPDDADDEIDIRVRFPREARSIEQIGDLRVRTNQGMVPITNFVTIVPQQQVNKIDRVDGHRIMRVRANTEDGVLANDKVAEIQAWIDQAGLDPRVEVKFRGANEEQAESGQFLVMAAIGGLLAIFAILLVQFNNFWHCFVVLSAVIFSTIGVLLGMLVMGQTFSIIMTGTGIVALAGVIVNNNIVLVDTFQELLRSGMKPMEAIVRTGAQRLRPVFLTSTTTVAGLLPMMFATSIDFFDRSITVGAPETLWWVQLATAVVFGLSFGTVLTLLVTPSLLALPYVIKARWRARFDRARGMFGMRPRVTPAE